MIRTKIAISLLAVAFYGGPVFSQSQSSDQQAAAPSYVASRVSEYALDSTKDPSVTPVYLIYLQIFQEVVGAGRMDGFTSLDIELLRSLSLPTHARFNRGFWDAVSQACDRLEKDKSTSALQEAAFRLDSAVEEYDQELNLYYAEAVKQLSISAQAFLEHEASLRRELGNFHYSAVRVAELAQDEPNVAAVVVNGACANFSAIDIAKALEENDRQTIGNMKLELTEIRQNN